MIVSKIFKEIENNNKKKDEFLKKSNKKIIIDNASPGAGKSTFAGDYGNNNHDLIIELVNDDYESTQTFWNILAKRYYHNCITLCSKTHELNNFLKRCFFNIKAPFAPNYLCNLHNDSIFTKIKNQFVKKDICENCSEKDDCNYLINKNALFEKLNEKYIEIFGPLHIILVKSYLRTDIIKNLLERYKDLKVLIVIDEDIFRILYEQVTFDNKVKINNYIEFIDELINSHNLHDKLNQNGMWDDIKRLLELFNNRNYKMVKHKENEIIASFEELIGKYEFKSFIDWNDDVSDVLKDNSIVIGRQTINIMPDLLKIFEDVYEYKKNKEYVKNIQIFTRSQHFSYSINRTREITEIFKKAKKILIASSVLRKDDFELFLPELKNDVDVMPNPNIRCHFKSITSKTNAKYPKYMFIRGYRKYTICFERAMNYLKNSITNFPKKKILIVSFKEFNAEIKKRLKKWAKKQNPDRESNGQLIDIDFDYFYHVDGKNKYENHDVLIIFGAPGIPKRAIEVMLNHILRNNPHYKKDPLKIIQIRQRLEEIYCEDQIWQVAERLRTFIHRDEKHLVLITKVFHRKFNMRIKIPKWKRDEYKKFYDKLRNRPNNTINDCLTIFNYTYIGERGPIGISGMRKIMVALEKEGSISIKKVKNLNGIYGWLNVYNVIIK